MECYILLYNNIFNQLLFVGAVNCCLTQSESNDIKQTLYLRVRHLKNIYQKEMTAIII